MDLPSRDGSPALGATERSRLRPTLPDPPCFDGKRSNFPTWLLEIGNKLDTDGAAIGTHEAQFAYVYARLDSTPQKMAAAYVRQGGPRGAKDPRAFLHYLQSCYGDPNAAKRALDRLSSFK